MFVTLRYPTKQQNMIWLRRRKEEAPSRIADDLNVSRPFISKAQRIAEARITKLLKNAAAINRISVENLSAKHGFAVGCCHTYNTNTFITYSPEFGVNVWFEHSGDCSSCDRRGECDHILRGLAKEWDIKVTRKMAPDALALHLFSSIRGKLGWT